MALFTTYFGRTNIISMFHLNSHYFSSFKKLFAVLHIFHQTSMTKIFFCFPVFHRVINRIFAQVWCLDANLTFWSTHLAGAWSHLDRVTNFLCSIMQDAWPPKQPYAPEISKYVCAKWGAPCLICKGSLKRLEVFRMTPPLHDFQSSNFSHFQPPKMKNSRPHQEYTISLKQLSWGSWILSTSPVGGFNPFQKY